MWQVRFAPLVELDLLSDLYLYLYQYLYLLEGCISVPVRDAMETLLNAPVNSRQLVDTKNPRNA